MENLINTYNYYLSIGDKRVEEWPLMKTPVNTSIILIGYALSIWLIKVVMQSRQPFELRLLLIVYNAFQVLVSLYISVEVLTVAILSKYSLVCQPVDYSEDPLSMRMASVLWLYFIVKIIDLIDTVLFALRKKQNQITFLHVFHHSSMVANGWFGVKYVPGGQTFFLCFLNSFVHVVMYTYYGLSALGPSVQKHLWWKKYLTQFQLIQFFVICVHSLTNIYAECSYPKGFSWSFIIYGVFIALLFLNFYSNSYTKPAKSAQNGKAHVSNGEAKSNGVHSKRGKKIE